MNRDELTLITDELRKVREQTAREIRDLRDQTSSELRQLRETALAKFPLIDHRLKVVEEAGAVRETRLAVVEKNQVRYSAFFAAIGTVLGYLAAALTKKALH